MLRLFKQVADSRRAYAHEHFHKIRTRQGEKGHIGLSGHRLGKQRLACSGRAHQQRTFGQFGANLHISGRIMQKIHDLCQRFLRLVLARHVLEGNSGCLLDINLRIGLAHTHNTAATGSSHKYHQHYPYQNNGKYIDQKKIQYGRAGIRHHALEFYIRCPQTGYQLITLLRHHYGKGFAAGGGHIVVIQIRRRGFGFFFLPIGFLLSLRLLCGQLSLCLRRHHKPGTGFLDRHAFDLPCLYHVQKFIVRNFLRVPVHHAAQKGDTKQCQNGGNHHNQHALTIFRELPSPIILVILRTHSLSPCT